MPELQPYLTRMASGTIGAGGKDLYATVGSAPVPTGGFITGVGQINEGNSTVLIGNPYWTPQTEFIMSPSQAQPGDALNPGVLCAVYEATSHTFEILVINPSTGTQIMNVPQNFVFNWLAITPS